MWTKNEIQVLKSQPISIYERNTRRCIYKGPKSNISYELIKEDTVYYSIELYNFPLCNFKGKFESYRIATFDELIKYFNKLLGEYA